MYFSITNYCQFHCNKKRVSNHSEFCRSKLAGFEDLLRDRQDNGIIHWSTKEARVVSPFIVEKRWGGKISITFIVKKTSPVDWEIPPTKTISFSIVILAILDPYLDIDIMEQYERINYLPGFTYVRAHLPTPYIKESNIHPRRLKKVVWYT